MNVIDLDWYKKESPSWDNPDLKGLDVEAKINKEDLPKEVKTETFAGFIWINMHEKAPSLKEWLGPVWKDWEAYEIHKWKRYVAQTVNVPCNWKIILDNFNESYHLPTVHAPERAVTKRRMPRGVDTSYKNTQFDLSEEGHNRMIMRAGYGSMQEDGQIEDCQMELSFDNFLFPFFKSKTSSNGPREMCLRQLVVCK